MHNRMHVYLHAQALLTHQTLYLFSLHLHAPGPLQQPRSEPPSASSASQTLPSVSVLTDELRLLETERDEAVKTAEDCARTAGEGGCVRLKGGGVAAVGAGRSAKGS